MNAKRHPTNRILTALRGAVIAAAGIATFSIAAATPASAAELRADVDGDCVVGFGDLMIMVSHWGASYGSLDYDERVDFDGNGRISFTDFQYVAGQWGKTCDG